LDNGNVADKSANSLESSIHQHKNMIFKENQGAPSEIKSKYEASKQKLSIENMLQLFEKPNGSINTQNMNMQPLLTSQLQVSSNETEKI
jgi:hypothetical protein